MAALRICGAVSPMLRPEDDPLMVLQRLGLGRSQKDGLPPRSRESMDFILDSRPSTRAEGGAAGRCPFQICTLTKRRKMEPNLAALSLFGATLAWGVDHAVFTSVFAALGTVAVLGAAAPRRRR